MKNFNKRGGSRFGGGERRFGNDRGPAMMHKATCSECGNVCEVPFRPTGDKPIFCSECFSAKRGEAPRAPRGGRFGGNDRGPRRDFAPRNEGATSSAELGEMKKQVEFLGIKIDRLTKIVEGLNISHAHTTPEKSAAVKKAIKEAKAPAKKVAKKTTKKASTKK